MTAALSTSPVRLEANAAICRSNTAEFRPSGVFSESSPKSFASGTQSVSVPFDAVESFLAEREV